MPNLLPCLLCGRLVSPTASRCPNCSALAPSGVECGICGNKLAMGEAFHAGPQHGYFHPACLVTALTPPNPYKCPDCLTPLGIAFARAQVGGQRYPDCPRCGRRFAYDSRATCGHCGLEIFKFQDMEQGEDITGYNDDVPRYAGIHGFCAAGYWKGRPGNVRRKKPG